MILALKSVLIGYFVVWLVLLIACIRRREFCIVFSNSQRTRWFWLATFVFLNPLLTVLYLIYGQFRSPQARPIHIARDVALVIILAGFFVNFPGVTHLWMQPFLGRSAHAVPGAAEAHLAVIEARNDTNSSSSTSSSDNSRLACRHLAVILEGGSPLLRRVGSVLVEQLKKIPAVESVDLQPDGVFPENGRQAPDIFIRLRLARLKETVLPYSLDLNVQISVDYSREALRNIHGYHDTRMPPLLGFNGQIQLTHASTTTGYESVRYSMAAGNIATELGKQIAKTLEGWREKHGLLPDLPAGFYGDYRASELPEPFDRLKPTLLGSYTGLLTHNETYRQFTLADEPTKPVEELRDAMTALGWKVLSGEWKTPNIDLRLEKDDRRIHVFQIRSDEPFSGQIVMVRPSAKQPASLFGVADVQQFSDAEMKTVLDGLLTEPVSLERLMLFERMFDKEQQERFLSVLEERSPRDVLSQIRLAEMYQRKSRLDDAMKAMTQARTLLWVAQDDGCKGRLKSLAKSLGDEKLAEVKPTEQDFRDAGFVELTAGGEAVEVEVPLNEPAVVFCRDRRSEPHVFSLAIGASGNSKDPFIAKWVHRMAHGYSSSTRGGFTGPNGLWQCASADGFDNLTVKWQITQAPDRNHFAMSFASRPTVIRAGARALPARRKRQAIVPSRGSLSRCPPTMKCSAATASRMPTTTTIIEYGGGLGCYTGERQPFWTKGPFRCRWKTGCWFGGFIAGMRGRCPVSMRSTATICCGWRRPCSTTAPARRMSFRIRSWASPGRRGRFA